MGYEEFIQIHPCKKIEHPCLISCVEATCAPSEEPDDRLSFRLRRERMAGVGEARRPGAFGVRIRLCQLPGLIMSVALLSGAFVTLGCARRESSCSRWVLSLIILSAPHLPPAAAPCSSPPPHRFPPRLHRGGRGPRCKDRKSEVYAPTAQPNRQPQPHRGRPHRAPPSRITRDGLTCAGHTDRPSSEQSARRRSLREVWEGCDTG